MARLHSRRITPWVIGITLASTLLSGCAASNSGDSPANKPAQADSPELAAALKGNEGTPPTTSPAPAKGKSVWWISCGEVTESCASFTAAGKAAAEAMGWDFHVADGNLNQANGHATALRTALAARPDAIIQDAFSCDGVQPELQQAKTLGIPVLGLETLDCSDAGVGPQLFTIPMIYSETYPDNKSWWTGWGAWSAKFLIADSGGTGKIITSMGKGDPQYDFLNKGFKDELAKCSGCSTVADVSWTTTDLAPNGPWVTGLRNALVKNPTADYVWLPFDTLAVDSGGAKAVVQSGSKAKMISGVGTAPALDLIRSGQLYAEGVARSSQWPSWAAMDEINRHFNGQPSVPEGMGFVSAIKNHNVTETPGEGYKTAVPFEQLYKKAWGVG